MADTSSSSPFHVERPYKSILLGLAQNILQKYYQKDKNKVLATQFSALLVCCDEMRLLDVDKMLPTREALDNIYALSAIRRSSLSVVMPDIVINYVESILGENYDTNDEVAKKYQWWLKLSLHIMELDPEAFRSHEASVFKSKAFDYRAIAAQEMKIYDEVFEQYASTPDTEFFDLDAENVLASWNELERLGSGFFGEVRLSPNRKWAIKKLLLQAAADFDGNYTALFNRAEIVSHYKLFKDLRAHQDSHWSKDQVKNFRSAFVLVEHISFTSDLQKAFLYSRYVPRGDLESALEKLKRLWTLRRYSPKRQRMMALSAFVSSVKSSVGPAVTLMNKVLGVTHRDLAARNILLDAVALLADFGLCGDFGDNPESFYSSHNNIPVKGNSADTVSFLEEILYCWGDALEAETKICLEDIPRQCIMGESISLFQLLDDEDFPLWGPKTLRWVPSDAISAYMNKDGTVNWSSVYQGFLDTIDSADHQLSAWKQQLVEAPLVIAQNLIAEILLKDEALHAQSLLIHDLNQEVADLRLEVKHLKQQLEVVNPSLKTLAAKRGGAIPNVFNFPN